MMAPRAASVAGSLQGMPRNAASSGAGTTPFDSVSPVARLTRPRRTARVRARIEGALVRYQARRIVSASTPRPACARAVDSMIACAGGAFAATPAQLADNATTLFHAAGYVVGVDRSLREDLAGQWMSPTRDSPSMTPTCRCRDWQEGRRASLATYSCHQHTGRICARSSIERRGTGSGSRRTTPPITARNLWLVATR